MKTNTGISIHALLAESDTSRQLPATEPPNFYPRSPCGERQTVVDNIIFVPGFLSTLSLRRATPPVRDVIQWEGIFLSTLSLRRATLRHSADCNCHSISIHALLAESDKSTRQVKQTCRVFLSTLSLRRATAKVHKTVGHFCAYETNFMGIASSC